MGKLINEMIRASASGDWKIKHRQIADIPISAIFTGCKSFGNLSTNTMGKLQQVANSSKKIIDYRIGFLGALFLGGVVFGINYFATNNISGSFTAALKQGIYTFFLGGIFMKGCENLATKIKNRTLAIAAAIVIPSALTLLLTFTMHNFKGTPKPLESTFPTMLIIPATAVWAYRKRTNFAKSAEPLTHKGRTS